MARRRSIDHQERLTERVSVSITPFLAERLQELSQLHGIAAGTIARAAIEAGLRSVQNQLRRGAAERGG